MDTKRGLRTVMGFVLSMLALPASAQSADPSHAGTYFLGLGVPPQAGLYGKDTIMSLTLSPNGTFRLLEPDGKHGPNRISNGKWISDGNRVILNPSLDAGTVDVSVKAEMRADPDSITIRISRYNDSDPNTPLPFQGISVCFDKKGRYHHLVERPIDNSRGCAFAPRIRRQCAMQKDGTFRIARREFRRIGFYGYDFHEVAWFDVSDASGYFDVTVTESDPTARKRTVYIDGGRAYTEVKKNGKPAFLATPLRKINP